MSYIGVPVLSFLLSLFPAMAAFAQSGDELPPVPKGETWKMIWNDEFDGTQIDSAKWGHRPEGAHRDAWWMNKAVSLDGDGHLVISVFQEGDKFVSGNVITKP